MDKKINFIIVSTNAYATFETRDIAGAMRIRNIFNGLIEKTGIKVSNLIMLDLFGIEHNGQQTSLHPKVKCLAIGYTSIINPFSVLNFLKRGIKFINQQKQKSAINIIYNYQYPDIRNFLLLVYAKSRGFKIVFDLVEDKQHYPETKWNDRLNKKLSLFFLRIMPRYADAAFVISSHLEKEIAKITKNKIPIFSLPISVDFNNLHFSNHEKSKGDVEVFYGGSFGQKDGLEYLLEAINILQRKNYRFKLILSGKGEPADEQKLFPLIKSNPLIEHRGFLSTEAYFKLLGSVDICCMTRVKSAFANAGFPFKLGEFLAAGKVIVATRIGDVEKYLVHKENAYLINPESAEEIAEAIAFCIDNLPSLSQTMGPKARQVAKQYFDAAFSGSFLLEKCISISE